MDKADLAAVLAVLEAVSKRHFDGGPIDSEKIGNDHLKRKEVLEDLEELPSRFSQLSSISSS